MLLGHQVTAGSATAGATVKAIFFAEDNDVCKLPAIFAGHYDGSANQVPEPYGFGFKFSVEDVSNGPTYLVGASADGGSMFNIWVETNGDLKAQALARNASGQVKEVVGGGSLGTVTDGAVYSLHIRSENVSSSRRNASGRLDGVTTSMISTTTSPGNAGGADRAIRVGGDNAQTTENCTLWDMYGTLVRPDDADCDDIDAATDATGFLAAVVAIVSTGAAFPVLSTDDLSTGVENTGTGSDATCTGMTNAGSLVSRPA